MMNDDKCGEVKVVVEELPDRAASRALVKLVVLWTFKLVFRAITGSHILR